MDENHFIFSGKHLKTGNASPQLSNDIPPYPQKPGIMKKNCCKNLKFRSSFTNCAWPKESSSTGQDMQGLQMAWKYSEMHSGIPSGNLRSERTTNINT
jgi:hypothetical protein